MSGTDGPIAPWAFRAALSGLPDGEVRSILESDRCPQPTVRQDHTIVDEEADTLTLRQSDSSTWLRSDLYVSLDDWR